ncbi:DUF2752 domain-containing protein [Galbibacter orientalis]|uniref:DUF2752 domain-containing protein n=2 Tax=Galbibacter TaxID=379068 RepID=I3C969_9FLAO|nr:DUF2752 domain-containing protein [Galbibacter orientalis]EIJ40162.1 Protein of unknown function (DUF2752) [Galbibacter orientalis DSM 19592]
MTFLLFTKAEDFMLPCLNKKLFGMECLGCGLQRSVALLFQGEFVAAFKMYPAIYPLIMFIGFIIASTFTNIKLIERLKYGFAIITISTIIISYIIKIIN